MKFEMKFRPGDDVRIVWLLAFLVVGLGFYYVQTQYQSAIGASHDRAETLYRRMVSNERIVREAATLTRVQQEAQTDLKRLSRSDSLSQTTAMLLTTLQESAQRFRTRVLDLTPVQGNTDASKAAIASGLQAMQIDIRVRGKFKNILGFVEDLSHHATLISVSDTSLSLSNVGTTSSGEPNLDATIHATLYRLQIPSAQKEPRLATAY